MSGDDTAASTSPPKSRRSERRRRYRCIYCLHPVPALIRIRGNDLQLLACDDCGAPSLDPYLEREFILVAMDLFLLRLPAVRHILCNRWRSPKEEKEPNQASDGRIDAPSAPQLLLLLVVVRTHLGQIAAPHRRPVDQTDAVLLTSWIHGLIVSTMGAAIPYGIGPLCGGMWPRRNDEPMPRPDRGAFLVPTALVYIATDVIHLWENSATVRQIGSVWLLIHQYLLLFTILQLIAIGVRDDNDNRSSAPPNNMRRLLQPGALAFGIGLLSLFLRGVVMEMYWTLFVANHTTMPCPGFYLAFWEATSPRICLV
jgi:Arv1-like family